MAARHRTWEGTDPRDAAFDRVFSIFDPDDVDTIHGGHRSILILLAVPNDRLEKAVIVHRQRSTDARRDVRVLVAMLKGGDGADPDRARNLRNRLALARRDFGGACDVKIAVYYGTKIPARDHAVEPPSPAMLDRIRHELEHEDGLGGHHWKTALTLDELPTPPHARLHVALVGVDARGRLHDALPRPNVHDLDRWMRRDARRLVAAMMEDPTFKQTITYCDEHGLTLLWLCRSVEPHRSP